MRRTKSKLSYFLCCLWCFDFYKARGRCMGGYQAFQRQPMLFLLQLLSEDKPEPIILGERRYPPPITNQVQATVPHDVWITPIVSIFHALRETALKEYLSPMVLSRSWDLTGSVFPDFSKVLKFLQKLRLWLLESMHRSRWPPRRHARHMCSVFICFLIGLARALMKKARFLSI